MPQRPKEHVRRSILAAAAEEFAESGYAGATLERIAARAGTSIGNLYKYFSSKEDLFAAAIPPSLVRELALLLRKRVEAVGVERDIGALGQEHPYHLASAALHRFAMAHRHALVFLLRNAEGTAYASFSEHLVKTLTNLALRYAVRSYPQMRQPPVVRRVVRRIYRGFLDSIAASLAEEATERALLAATEAFTRYHLTGLRALLAGPNPSTPERTE